MVLGGVRAAASLAVCLACGSAGGVVRVSFAAPARMALAASRTLYLAAVRQAVALGVPVKEVAEDVFALTEAAADVLDAADERDASHHGDAAGRGGHPAQPRDNHGANA